MVEELLLELSQGTVEGTAATALTGPHSRTWTLHTHSIETNDTEVPDPHPHTESTISARTAWRS
jgi:hypothetical protein